MYYAPQFGSAKNSVNFVRMVAANILRGDMPVSHWESVDGAVNIPLATATCWDG